MELQYTASGVRTVILRAGNFIDPERTDDVMSLMFLRTIKQGNITVAGDVNALQAYCYLPDWAAAAVALAEKRLALDVFEDVPFGGHSFTAEELRRHLCFVLNRELNYRRLPWWALKLTSPFWEMAREMLEMRYLWSTSHTLSNDKLLRLVPEFRATDLDVVMRAGIPPEMLNASNGANRRDVNVAA
jgi:nucleoside-diphosphate-sugar epimerase